MLEAEAPALRHEFIDGDIVAIAGGSDLHSALIAALSGEYVLVAQDEALIEVRSCDDSGNWTVRVYREGQQATIGAIGATLGVEAIYREATKNALA